MTLFVFNNGISSIISANQKAYNFDQNRHEKKPLLSQVKQHSNDTHSPNQQHIIDNSDLDTLQNRRLLTAAVIMSKPVISVMSHELVIKAKLLMQKHQLTKLVVINKNKSPVGVLGLKEIQKSEFPETSFIQNILEPIALAISEKTLVREIALHFIKNKTSVFCVVNDENQVTGIVSRSDLLKLLVSSQRDVNS
ncbi:CBS domain-containing protein [Gammaproteobacteria bacterium AS21]